MYVPEPVEAPEPQPTWQVLPGVRRVVRRQVPKSWMFGIGALTLAVGVLYVHTVAQEAHVQAQQREIRELKEANTAKRSMLAAMQSPQRIENVATRQLAMQEPKEVVFLNKPVESIKATPVNRIPPPPAVIHEGF